MNPAARDEYLDDGSADGRPAKVAAFVDRSGDSLRSAGRIALARHENEAAFNAARSLPGDRRAVDRRTGARTSSRRSFGRFPRSTRSSIARSFRPAFIAMRTRLAEALRVLEIERETWQQVCERLGRSARRRRTRAHPLRRPLASICPARTALRRLSFEAERQSVRDRNSAIGLR